MCDIKRTKLFDWEFYAVMSLLITRNSYANNDGNSRYFIPYLWLVIYTNILSTIPRRPINSKDVGSRPSNCLFFYYYYSAISALI